ncbi:MAG: hypothetical protein V4547_01965 [Bacteroidota bacterium]
MKALQIISFRIIFSFVLLFLISLPFPHHFIPDIGQYLSSYFEVLVKWFGENVFHFKRTYTSKLVSDSTGLYIHVFSVFIISVLISVTWTIIDTHRNNHDKLKYWFKVIISYYLSMQLFEYGFNKLFKYQFYLPEPNTLFTPIGGLSPDILYWSTMGASYSYTVFMGLLEIIPAILLLFKRTRLLGAIIAMGILINITMINFGFDISVKVYSCFLLFLSIVIVSPDLKKIFSFFILNKQVITNEWEPKINSKKRILFYSTFKSLVIGLILVDTLSVYFMTNNFNDDKAQRPFLHGAYNVEIFVKNNDTLAPLQTDKYRLKRVFIHREGYLITQSMNDEMQDYKLRYEIISNKLILESYDSSKITLDYIYNKKDSTLFLSGRVYNDSIKIYSKQIDLGKLPIFQQNFHWTIDSYN